MSSRSASKETDRTSSPSGAAPMGRRLSALPATDDPLTVRKPPAIEAGKNKNRSAIPLKGWKFWLLSGVVSGRTSALSKRDGFFFTASTADRKKPTAPQGGTDFIGPLFV